MRLKLVPFAFASLLSVGTLALRASAQNPDTMMPEQSTAKAKQILSDLINARGGAGYKEAVEGECHGTRAQFGHNGDVTGYVGFTDYRRYPDKARLEYSAKSHNLKSIINTVIGVDGLDWSHGGVIIALYNGDHGWTLDRSGVTELPDTSISEFQEQVKRNIDNVLRVRLKEPGWNYRYGGSDTVDLKEVDWVELTDSEERTFRLAVDHSTHLLVRSIVTTNNEETHERDDDVSIYTNYQLKDTVWTPMQVTRDHNGRRAAQFFYDSCRFNPGFPSDFFDKSSLQKKTAEAGVKKNKNDKN
ncbi:MAG TPA: hypothetical protein VNH65_11535 [Candidatus Acidoferrum sp.]|nr:hypothetical protein [Candidatus Acidoferrum sp.]